tara:strand:- start:137 stop:268 length:132 start_codon:yes stop_codon:yes gene_type:complete
MATGMYVYFENYGRYDWTRYFTGLLARPKVAVLVRPQLPTTAS